MTEDPHAGPCVSGRHQWGPEKNYSRTGSQAVYHEPCKKCKRVRVRVYGKSGNHVRGYFTRAGRVPGERGE